MPRGEKQVLSLLLSRNFQTKRHTQPTLSVAADSSVTQEVQYSGSASGHMKGGVGGHPGRVSAVHEGLEEKASFHTAVRYGPDTNHIYNSGESDG